ncbi:MAG TPA: inorganic phosphate transporter, partial [Clostridia bacterium]|nr:inorganic phosphate transporter [Clostridia bacterium]
MYYYLISAVFLGWALGANDSANCFGTAVATRVVKYSHAVTLTAILVVLGAFMEGAAGMEKLGVYAALNGVSTGHEAFLVMTAAAVTVGSLTLLKIPISTSQAVIGAIIGSGIAEGRFVVMETYPFFGAWFATPLGAMAIGYILYSVMSKHVQKRINNIELFDRFVKIGFIIAGAFSAYALGANNVANI